MRLCDRDIEAWLDSEKLVISRARRSNASTGPQ